MLPLPLLLLRADALKQRCRRLEAALLQAALLQVVFFLFCFTWGRVRCPLWGEPDTADDLKQRCFLPLIAPQMPAPNDTRGATGGIPAARALIVSGDHLWSWSRAALRRYLRVGESVARHGDCGAAVASAVVV
ncbi:unnamed protein product [Lampetra planeri]